jgi:peroxisomal membrane protein 4
MIADLNNANYQAALERIILDPRHHDILAVLKAARNGAVYGTKVRFPHALVYVPTCRERNNHTIYIATGTNECLSETA